MKVELTQHTPSVVVWWRFRLHITYRQANRALTDYVLEWKDTDVLSPSKNAERIATRGLAIALYTDPQEAPVGFTYVLPHQIVQIQYLGDMEPVD